MLSDSIGSVTNDLQELESRLESVVTPMPPPIIVTDNDEERPSLNLVPLALQLDSLRKCIVFINDQITSIMERIKL